MLIKKKKEECHQQLDALCLNDGFQFENVYYTCLYVFMYYMEIIQGSSEPLA